MERGLRPSPLQDIGGTSQQGPSTRDAGGDNQGAEENSSGMPVRNTFIDFTERQQFVHPITAPAKYAARLGGSHLVSVPDTPVPTPGVLPMGRAATEMPQPVVAPAIYVQPVAAPPPLQMPTVRAPMMGFGPGSFPPPQSVPRFPLEIASPVSSAPEYPMSPIDPVKEVSPSTADSDGKGSPPIATAPAAARHVPLLLPMGPPLAQGSLIEITPMVQANAPPMFAPPSYAIPMFSPAAGHGYLSAPPVHTPACATPAQSQMQQSHKLQGLKCFSSLMAAPPTPSAQSPYVRPPHIPVTPLATPSVSGNDVGLMPNTPF